MAKRKESWFTSTRQCALTCSPSSSSFFICLVLYFSIQAIAGLESDDTSIPARPVPTDDPLVLSAARHAVNVISDTYVRVLSSPKYYTKGKVQPWFSLAEVKSASARPLTGIKFYLDLLLVNSFLDDRKQQPQHPQQPLQLTEGDTSEDEKQKDSIEALNKLTSWRTEHMGNIPIDQKIDLQSKETPEEKNRIRTAFLMGIDPLKFRKMKNLPGQEPELHRVTVFMDKRGEFELEYHRHLPSPSPSPSFEPTPSIISPNATTHSIPSPSTSISLDTSTMTAQNSTDPN